MYVYFNEYCYVCMYVFMYAGMFHFTIPALAPASIAMLQMDILASIDIAAMDSPERKEGAY